MSAQRLIEIAIAEADANVREIGGANRGERVEQYQRTVGLRPGDPWCAAFVAWCIMQSRDLTKAPAWCSGSAITTWQRGSKRAGASNITVPTDRNLALRVAPGWIWVRAKDAKGATHAARGLWVQGHCGIVVAVDDAGFHTVEGNTNSAGSREGDGVYRKLHRWDNTKQMARTLGWFNSDAAMEASDVQANA